MRTFICSHNDLEVYRASFDSAMKIFETTKSFPREEKFSLVDQIRRSSRSVCANIAEAFRKRRYPLAFVAKLSDAEGEAAETQVWVNFAEACGYMKSDQSSELQLEYDRIIGKIVMMITRPEVWKPNR